jgi:UDP-glucose 4-epimerase
LKLNETALVTGVAGFIGSHLAEELLHRGYSVVGIDCFTDYYPREIKETNLANLMVNENFKFIKADLLDVNFKDLNVDYIFHMAAQPGVRASWGKSFQVYVKDNILVTQKLLEDFLDSEIKKFVFASSSSVYGDVAELPIREDALPKPISPYGVTKLAAENLCHLYWKNYGIPIVSLRYFTVYGPRQRPDMAIHKFVKAMLEDKEIVIYGDGNQTRDFTYISDAVEGTILAAKSNLEGEVFNIGGGSRTSVNQIIDTGGNFKEEG